MSQKLMLVRYELEDGIPIDESSENLQSAYAPTGFIDWMVKGKYASEVKIKESAGGIADIPVTTIDDEDGNCLASIVQYIEAELFRCIEETHSHISDVLIPEEIDNDLSALHIWLNLRAVLKEKQGSYRDSHNIKLVLG